MSGLTDKFRVERVDPMAQERHWRCRVFVLEPAHDVHARTALASYADAVSSENPELAADIRAWVADEIDLDRYRGGAA